MKVFSNTAMSADGKIATWRHDHVALGTDEDRRFMSVLRARADAVVVGGRTFRAWPLPLVEDPRHLDAPVERTRPVINAVLTRDGVAGVPARRWPDPRVELLVLGPESLDAAAHEAALGARVHTHPAPDLPWVLDVLAARGCRSVLIEGGGDLIFQCLASDRLDEMFITVCPLMVGGAGAPTPADGPGFEAGDLRRLRLLGLRQVEEEVYLHYAVGPSKG